MAPPAFQFYAKDWLIDTRELGPYGRGVLVDMIVLCWENGSIADDPTVVATAVGADGKQVARLWPALRVKFGTDPVRPGRLFNMRLEVEREKQSENRQKQSNKGKASAQARARAKVAEAFTAASTAVTTVVQPQCQPTPQPKVNSAICDLRSAVLPSEDPPLSPVGGTAAFGLSAPAPTVRQTRAEKKAAILEVRKVDAQTVLSALNAARLDVIPNSRPLRPTTENLTHIADRLEAGATVEECLHVVTVRAEEVRGGGEAKWFDAVTPFLADSFARSLAQPSPSRPHKSGRMTGAESEAAMLAKAEADCAKWRAEGLIP